MRYTFLVAVLALSVALSIVGFLNSRPDETLSAYGAGAREWQLQSINGTDFAARATIAFPQEGRITGRAPCNTYTATQKIPYPWFEISDLTVTKMACEDMASETAFFQMLGKMALVEVLDNLLVLSTETGEEMVFTAAAP